VPTTTEGLSLVKIDGETQLKINIAQKVFDEFLVDGVYGEYVLGEDLWNEFQFVFAKTS